MADQVITKQELIDAQKDAQTLEEVINGEPGKLVKTRLNRMVYTLASVPQINTMTREEVTAAVAPKANDAEVYKKTETFTRAETNALVAPKANQADVDNAISGMNSTLNTSLSNLSTTANKYYSTLAAANADIANIALNQSVTVGEVANSGLWYKATAGATSLTKSTYDPLTQAKAYADQVGLASNNYTDNKISVIRPLYNPTNNVTDKYINLAGEVASLAGTIMAVIPIQAGKTYAVKSGNFSATLFFIALRATNSADVGATLGKVTLTDTADPSVKIFTVPSGSTARYALINVKVSALDVRSSIAINQGVTIQTAEQAFLGNVKLVTASDIPNYGYLNATDVNKVINNLYSQQNNVNDKYIDTSGNVATSTGLIMTIVPVEAGKTYTIKANSFKSTALFIALRATNSADVGATLGKVTLTDTADPSVKTFTVPVDSTAKFAFIDVKVPSASFDILSDLIISEGETPVDGRYVDKILDLDLYDSKAREDIAVLKNSQGSTLTGKKWAAIGDSITANSVRTDHPYHYYVAQSVGGMTVYNYGSSGTGYFDRLHVASTISQNDIDILTVFLGTNDWGKDLKPLGNLFDTTDTTVSGCINILISELMNAFPTKTIALFTPLPRRTNWGSNAPPNNNGYTLKQLAELIKSYANHYSLPCLDLYNNSSLPVWIPSADAYYFTAPGGTSPDGLHPNDAGHQVLARKIQGFLESI